METGAALVAAPARNGSTPVPVRCLLEQCLASPGRQGLMAVDPAQRIILSGKGAAPPEGGVAARVVMGTGVGFPHDRAPVQRLIFSTGMRIRSYRRQSSSVRSEEHTSELQSR